MVWPAREPRGQVHITVWSHWIIFAFCVVEAVALLLLSVLASDVRGGLAVALAVIVVVPFLFYLLRTVRASSPRL